MSATGPTGHRWSMVNCPDWPDGELVGIGLDLPAVVADVQEASTTEQITSAMERRIPKSTLADTPCYGGTSGPEISLPIAAWTWRRLRVPRLTNRPQPFALLDRFND